MTGVTRFRVVDELPFRNKRRTSPNLPLCAPSRPRHQRQHSPLPHLGSHNAYSRKPRLVNCYHRVANHAQITNDDGPPSDQSSPYVHSLVSTLQQHGHTVSVVLPHTQRSWIGKAHLVGKSVRLHLPLQIVPRRDCANQQPTDQTHLLPPCTAANHLRGPSHKPRLYP